jgi:hypothetical protein
MEVPREEESRRYGSRTTKGRRWVLKDRTLVQTRWELRRRTETARHLPEIS